MRERGVHAAARLNLASGAERGDGLHAPGCRGAVAACRRRTRRVRGTRASTRRRIP